MRIVSGCMVRVMRASFVGEMSTATKAGSLRGTTEM